MRERWAGCLGGERLTAGWPPPRAPPPPRPQEFLTWQLPWHECGDNLWPLVARVLEGERLKVPEEGLPTAAFPGLPDYLRLMEDCWLADPGARPSFKDIISRLRKLLEAESLRLREAAGSSPSKLPRGSRLDLLNPEASMGSLTTGAGDASMPSPYASPTKHR